MPWSNHSATFPPYMYISIRVSQGGVVVYQYTRKKFAKIPKIHPNIPKIIPRYTLYLKFKESDIPNTRI